MRAVRVHVPDETFTEFIIDDGCNLFRLDAIIQKSRFAEGMRAAHPTRSGSYMLFERLDADGEGGGRSWFSLFLESMKAGVLVNFILTN
jgi:hypothetical protein